MPTREKQGFEDGGWDRWRRMKKKGQQWEIRLTVKCRKKNARKTKFKKG